MKFSESYFKERPNARSFKDMNTMKRAYFPRVLEIAKLNNSSKVLDIGCAFGYFLKLCDAMGCDTYGVDISEYAINRAKKQTKAKLYIQDVDEGLPMFPDNIFELVVTFDTIEHLNSPCSLLKEIRRTLRTGGKLVVTTPNLNAAGRLLKRFLGKEQTWYGFIDKTHKTLFTPSSLKHLAVEVGFEIMKLETPFHPLPRMLQKIANKTGLGGQIWLVGTKIQHKAAHPIHHANASHDDRLSMCNEAIPVTKEKTKGQQ